MEIEREFKKVDNALSAAALSAVIIHKQECSHDDIVTLESLVPGFVFENRAAKGFTNEASLENFSKIKDAVSNAITTAIKKIRELITRFIDWIKGKGNKTEKDAKKVAEDVKKTTDDANSRFNDLKQKEKSTTSTKEESEEVADLTRDNDNEALVRKWLLAADDKNTRILDAALANFTNEEFNSALTAILTSNTKAFNTNIIKLNGVESAADYKYYGEIFDVAKDAFEKFENLTASDDKDDDYTPTENDIKELSTMSLVGAFILKTAKVKNVPDSIEDTSKYKGSVAEAIRFLFDEYEGKESYIIGDSVDVVNIVIAFSNLKRDLLVQIPRFINIINFIEEITKEIDLPDSGLIEAQKKYGKLAFNTILYEVRLALDYCVRLNTLTNSIITDLHNTCAKIQGKNNTGE